MPRRPVNIKRAGRPRPTRSGQEKAPSNRTPGRQATSQDQATRGASSLSKSAMIRSPRSVWRTEQRQGAKSAADVQEQQRSPTHGGAGRDGISTNSRWVMRLRKDEGLGEQHPDGQSQSQRRRSWSAAQLDLVLGPASPLSFAFHSLVSFKVVSAFSPSLADRPVIRVSALGEIPPCRIKTPQPQHCIDHTTSTPPHRQKRNAPCMIQTSMHIMRKKNRLEPDSNRRLRGDVISSHTR